MPGVISSGNNRTGAADGQDEFLCFDLGNIDDASIQIMVVVISCFIGDFVTVKEVFVRAENEIRIRSSGIELYY